MEKIETILEEFDKWAETETATFGQGDAGDGYMEDYNIEFKELAFYDKLREKIKSMLQSL